MPEFPVPAESIHRGTTVSSPPVTQVCASPELPVI
jgi:hypothetical protein